ncbi:MAG: hypothetical protein AAF657_15390 [Acidobacteriota bacterium]
MNLPKIDPEPKSWSRRPWRIFAGVALAGLILAGAEGLGAGLRSRFIGPGHGACWIWAEGDYREGNSLAFFAARELEIEAPGSVRVAIVADESYILYVNSHRIGSGAYRPQAPIDEYEVGRFLQPGLNRFVVELRSQRGAGGLLATLEIGPAGDAAKKTRTVVTDEKWQIFRRYDRALFGGWARLAGGEPPKVWRLPPTGRWRLAAEKILRPVLFRGFPPPVRRKPVRLRAQHSEAWLDLDPVRPRIPPVGPKQLYDWGEEVEGFLTFDLTATEGEPGLLYLGSEPPDPEVSKPDQVILAVPGRPEWRAAFPSRFRYALVIGAEPYGRVEVEEIDAELRAALAPPVEPRGVFGFQPPRAYAKVEEDVWGRVAGTPKGTAED